MCDTIHCQNGSPNRQMSLLLWLNDAGRTPRQLLLTAIPYGPTEAEASQNVKLKLTLVGRVFVGFLPSWLRWKVNLVVGKTLPILSSSPPKLDNWGLLHCHRYQHPTPVCYTVFFEDSRSQVEHRDVGRVGRVDDLRSERSRTMAHLLGCIRALVALLLVLGLDTQGNSTRRPCSACRAVVASGTVVQRGIPFVGVRGKVHGKVRVWFCRRVNPVDVTAAAVAVSASRCASVKVTMECCGDRWCRCL